MARLDRLVIGGERQIDRDQRSAFLRRVLEMLKQPPGIGVFEIIRRKLLLIPQEHIAIGHAGVVVRQVVNALDALDIHRQPFEPIGQFPRHWRAFMAAHLLEIGELRHLHAVAPDFPAQPPGAERRRFPVVLHKSNIMGVAIDADGVQ